MPLQLRRGTDAQRSGVVFAAGELIYVTDTDALYIGDGATVGGIAVANLSASDVRSISAGVLTGGSHSGITFTPNGDFLDAVVDPDLSNYQGVIRASAFNGTLVDDSSTILIDAVASKINLDGTVKGNIIPDANSAYDIGSNSFKFRDLYLSGSSLYLGSAQVTAVGSAINLPVGSTIAGVPIGTGSGTGDGVVEGNTYKISIAAEDSSLMLNALTETVTASGGFFGNLNGNASGNHTGTFKGNIIAGDNSIAFTAGTKTFTGNLTGNVIGDVTGNVIGNVDGDIKGSLFAETSTMLIDGINGKIVGDIDNNTVSTGNIFLTSNLAAGGIEIQTQGSLDDDYGLFDILSSHNGASPSGFTLTRTRGTIAAPTALSTNDSIFSFLFAGKSSTTIVPSVSIDAKLDGSVGTGTVPGKLVIVTADSAGTMTDRLTIDSKGISAFAGMVQLPTYADETAANAAVVTPVNGMMYYDSGASKVKARQGGAWVVLQP